MARKGKSPGDKADWSSAWSAGVANGGIRHDLLQRSILRMVDPELRRMVRTLPIEIVRMHMRQRDGRLVLVRALAVYLELVEPGSPGVARMIQTDLRLAPFRPRLRRSLAHRLLRTAVRSALARHSTTGAADAP